MFECPMTEPAHDSDRRVLQSVFDLAPGRYEFLIQLDGDAGTLARYPMTLWVQKPGDATRILDAMKAAQEALLPLLPYLPDEELE
jgi:hypothetical protein